MAKAVGIEDVARAAGVSNATVSHALTGRGRVSDSTRLRVKETATRLGYVPNQHASGLSSGRSRMLALQVANYDSEQMMPSSLYFSELVNGAAAAARSHGYSLLLAPTYASLGDCRSFSFDGVIVVDATGKEALLTAGLERGCPAVTVGRQRRGTADQVVAIDVDHARLISGMLDHLHDGGYCHPAILADRSRIPYVRESVNAYRRWARRRHIDPVVIQASPLTLRSAADATERVLASTEVDAVHALTDDSALGVVMAARRMGRRIPQELGLTASMDSPAFEAVEPTVTAAQLDAPGHGAAAVDQLVALIEGRRTPGEFIETSFVVNYRGSSRGRVPPALASQV